MNKPVEFRGKKHRGYGNGSINPQDEMKDILSGKVPPPVPQKPKQEEQVSTRPILDLGDGNMITDELDPVKAAAKFAAGDIVKAEDLVRGEETPPNIESDSESHTQIGLGVEAFAQELLEGTATKPEDAVTSVEQAATSVEQATTSAVDAQTSAGQAGAAIEGDALINDVIRGGLEKVGEWLTKNTDDGLYHPQEFKIIFVRFPKGCDAVREAKIRQMLDEYPESITGLISGFQISTGGTKTSLERHQSNIKLAYLERKHKEVMGFYLDWGYQIERGGFNDGTTVEFFVIEPTEDGNEVLDAWWCRGMYPKVTSVLETDRRKERFADPIGLEVGLGGVISQGPSQLDHARRLWAERNTEV